MTTQGQPSFDQFLQQTLMQSVTSKLGGGNNNSNASDASSVDGSETSSHTTTAKLQQYVVSKLRPWSAFFDRTKFRVPRRELSNNNVVSLVDR
jgi:hypothetical protein